MTISFVMFGLGGCVAGLLFALFANKVVLPVVLSQQPDPNAPIVTTIKTIYRVVFPLVCGIVGAAVAAYTFARPA